MKSNYRIEKPDGITMFVIILLILAILTGIGLFAWWAFSFSTHTLVWLIFIFGSLLGSIRIKSR